MYYKYLLLPCLAFNLSYAMEQDNEQLQTPDTGIEMQKKETDNPDSKKSEDISIWFCAKYKFAQKFSNKTPEEVDSVLAELIQENEAPFKQREKLKNLRTIISKLAISEVNPKENNSYVYLTCSKDNAVDLRSALELQEDLVCNVYAFELSKLNYQQQFYTIVAQQRTRPRQDDCTIV